MDWEGHSVSDRSFLYFLYLPRANISDILYLRLLFLSVSEYRAPSLFVSVSICLSFVVFLYFILLLFIIVSVRAIGLTFCCFLEQEPNQPLHGDRTHTHTHTGTQLQTRTHTNTQTPSRLWPRSCAVMLV